MIKRIDEVLTLDRPLVGVDLETTGVKAKTSGICQIGLEIYLPVQPVKEYKTLVRPIMPIPASATKIHGITNEMVADAPTWLQLAAGFYAGMQGCDFIGFNVRFDLEQMFEEYKRAGMVFDYEPDGPNRTRILDGYRLWQVIEGRTLSHAVERWLKPSLEEATTDAEIAAELGDQHAHDALWDVRMSSRIVAQQILARQLSTNLDDLHAMQWSDWYDVTGRLKWMDGELCFSFGEHARKPVRTTPKGYLGWICRADFPDKVKDACRAAMNGQPILKPVVVADADPDEEPPVF